MCIVLMAEDIVHAGTRSRFRVEGLGLDAWIESFDHARRRPDELALL